jgi:hypothetical protein
MTATGLAALLMGIATGCLASDRPLVRGGAAAGNDPNPATAGAGAATDGELVISSPADHADVTVYGGAFAQVQETRKVSLKAGHNKIQLNGIAAKYRSSSLRVVTAAGPGAVEYKSATYQPANLTTDRLLAESVGKPVTARLWYGTQLREVTGKLQSVEGGRLVVEGTAGKTELISSADVTLLETPQGLSNTPALVVEADVKTAGDYVVTFLYETEGLSWSAQHSLIFDEENSTVKSWETSVSLVNESGTAFRGATVRLQSAANVEAADAPGGMYAERAAFAPMAAMRSPAAPVENVGDQKTYTLPGTVDLAAGQTRQIPLFTADNVPVKREYVVGTPKRYSASGKYDAGVRLTVDNCEKNGLGKPIPSGLVKVYHYNSGNKLQLTGSVSLGEKAQDETFELNIGTSSDIKWEVKLASATPVADAGDAQPAPAVAPRPGFAPGRVLVDPTAQPQTAPQAEKQEWEDRTYEVTVYNFKRDKDVTVKVEVNVPAKQQLKPHWKRPSADRAQTDVVVPKSGKTTVDYTVRTRVR